MDIILFTRGTIGDIYPFLHVGRQLQQMGCKVILMSNYRYREHADQEGFGFLALDDKEWFDYLNNMPEAKRKLPALLELYRDLIPATLAKELALVESQINVSNKTIILAHSNDCIVPLMAKEKFDIPLYLCVLAPSFVYSLFFFGGLLQSLSEEVNRIRNELGMASVEEWGQWMKGFTKAFAFWPTWFEDGKKNEIQPMENVGFPSVGSFDHRPLQKEVDEFLQCDKQVVAITHGTSRPFRDNYFELAIEACLDAGYKLLVITPFKEYLPHEVESDDVLVVDYCPFHNLLPSIDLLIHHGGIGTLREAIACGTPQLIIGKGYDRPHNGRIVKSLNVGDWIAPNALSGKLLKHTVESLLDSQAIHNSCKHYMGLLAEHRVCDDFYINVLNH